MRAKVSYRPSSESAIKAQRMQSEIQVNDYDALRDYLKKQTLPEFILQLRADRGNHRRRPAARGASGVVVGNAAQPAGEDAAARGLPRRRLHRDPPCRRQERAIQADEVRKSSPPEVSFGPTNGHPARFPIARKRGHMASGDTWRFGARVSACTGENAREGTRWKDCVRDRCSVRHWTGDRDRLRPSGGESHALRH